VLYGSIKIDEIDNLNLVTNTKYALVKVTVSPVIIQSKRMISIASSLALKIVRPTLISTIYKCRILCKR